MEWELLIFVAAIVVGAIALWSVIDLWIDNK